MSEPKETFQRPPEGLHSRLRPFIADSKEDGPDTVLIIQGFNDRAEIEEFMEKLMLSGVLYPPKSANS